MKQLLQKGFFMALAGLIVLALPVLAGNWGNGGNGGIGRNGGNAGIAGNSGNGVLVEMGVTVATAAFAVSTATGSI